MNDKQLNVFAALEETLERMIKRVVLETLAEIASQDEHAKLGNVRAESSLLPPSDKPDAFPVDFGLKIPVSAKLTPVDRTPAGRIILPETPEHTTKQNFGLQCQKCKEHKPARWVKGGTCTKCKEPSTPSIARETPGDWEEATPVDPKEMGRPMPQGAQDLMNDDELVRRCITQAVKQFGTSEFKVADFMCITNVGYEPTMQILRRSEKMGLTKKIDSEFRQALARWKVSGEKAEKQISKDDYIKKQVAGIVCQIGYRDFSTESFVDTAAWVDKHLNSLEIEYPVLNISEILEGAINMGFAKRSSIVPARWSLIPGKVLTDPITRP